MTLCHFVTMFVLCVDAAMSKVVWYKPSTQSSPFSQSLVASCERLRQCHAMKGVGAKPVVH
jgi:hypothetical protein